MHTTTAIFCEFFMPKKYGTKQTARVGKDEEGQSGKSKEAGQSTKSTGRN